MTKINKEYTLQTFKASASNTSQFLEGKGYKIPQTTLLHALSVFVGEKNWNTLQALLKNKSDEKTCCEHDSENITKIIDKILENLNDTSYLCIVKEETEETLSFIKNRLQKIKEKLFARWEEDKYYIDSTTINEDIHNFSSSKWHYDIANHILNKYDLFCNNISKNPDYFSKKHINEKQHKVGFISKSIDNKILYSTSKSKEIRMNILFNFIIFCLYEIQQTFFKNITYYIGTNKNNEDLLNYRINIFYVDEHGEENFDIFLKINFLKNFLRCFE